MLTKEQEIAINEVSSPLIIIAGPGTGKTTLITEKIISLITSKNYIPSEILALTFTQKATQEMTQRVHEKLSSNASDSPIEFQAKTFHSFALEILDEFQEKIPNLNQDYKLLDEANQILFFRENIDKFKLKSVKIKDKDKVSNQCASTILKLKDFGYSLKDLENIECNIHTKLDLFSLYSKYEKFKQEINTIDFGDILLLIKELLQDKKILKFLQERYKYILVDEFQDTNLLQLEIVNLISTSNITIVGDKKQSIYAFRGANYSNFEKFEKEKKNSKTIYLKDNFRSSEKIISQVNSIISNISSEKELLNSNKSVSSELKIIEAKNEFCELGFIIEKIRDLQSHNKNEKIGILTRRKSEAKKISEALSLAKIPHDATQINSVLDSNLVQEILHYLYFLDNPKEESTYLFKILQSQNLRFETLRSFSRKASLHEKSLYQVLKSSETFSEYKDENEIMLNLKEDLAYLLNLKSSKTSLTPYILKVIEKCNSYKKAIIQENDFEINALNEFIKFSKTALHTSKEKSLSRFLEIISISKIIPFSEEVSSISHNIEILTIHNSKGKEYDSVFLPSLNERKFPSNFQKPFFELPIEISKDEFIEEEKRLFFVGISRAKKNCYLSYTKRYSENKLDSKKSRLLDFLQLKVETYNREFIPQIFSEDESKQDLIKEISTLLISSQFTQAKSKIDLLEKITSKSSTLNAYLSNNDSEIKKYNFKEKEKIHIDPKKMVYSVSQLKTYDQCPKKYLFQYIYKIPTSSKHYFDFGTSIHEVLEIIQPLSKKLSQKELHLKALSQVPKVWISKSYESAEQEKEYFEKGIKAIKDFIKKEYEEYLPSKTLSLEKEFWLNIEGRRLMGYIDRIDETNEGIEILDYKTSNSMEPKSKLKENLQLYTYALALLQENKQPVKMGLWYLIHNQIDKVTFDEKIANKIRLELLNLIKEIEKARFNAKPSLFNCKYCDFSKICPSSLDK